MFLCDQSSMPTTESTSTSYAHFIILVIIYSSSMTGTMRCDPHLTGSPSAALASSAAARRVQGHHPRSPDVLWTRFQLPGRRLLPRHRRSPKKTALGWHSYTSLQSDSDQLPQHSIPCCWISSLELSADGPRTADSSYNLFRQSLKTFLIGQ